MYNTTIAINPDTEVLRMKLIFRYMRRYLRPIGKSVGLKFIATITELMLPYILEHLIDEVVPLGQLPRIFLWGGMMIAAAWLARALNVCANRTAVGNSHNVSYDVRRDLFDKTANLSGAQFDAFGLPSLISRMTSDSYNVQSCAQSLQTMCVRAPIMLIGGIAVTMTMDSTLSLILCVMLPVLLGVVLTVSRKGIPLYYRVQERLDDVVRVMRENITGIRVVKALSKTEYEKRRFAARNAEMAAADIKAGTVMAIPGPFMQICLNSGLALVVIVGAHRVNSGAMKPGVILAFLTYFNLVLQGAMGLNRIFMMFSKASASADRIDAVLSQPDDQPVLLPEQCRRPEGDEFIRFEHVNFSYGAAALNAASPDTAPDGSAAQGAASGASGAAAPSGKKSRRGANAARKDMRDTSPAAPEPAHGFAGEDRQQCLYDISFALNRGESLGIIGPTGCGKTTIINLLMRFYDVEDGGVFLDGRDVRTYGKDELHRKFGVVFQNDVVFNDTLRRNISFGRDVSEEDMEYAIADAMASEYIRSLDTGLEYVAAIKGANLSGGQKQRLLISRALAGDPEILILDDSSSALDYKTDASLRRAIFQRHGDAAIIMVAQRVSSVQGMTNILVMDEGRCIGYGSHAHLLDTCRQYREIYETQMGAMV